MEEEYIDSSLISELTALFHDRAFLNTYAEELHKEILPLGLSVYEVFGKLLNLSTAPTVEFTVNDLTKITKDQYASIMYCVSAFDKALRNMGGPLSANPWFGTKATSSGQVYKNIVDYLTVSVIAGRNELADAARQHDPKYNLATRRLSLPQILTQNRKNWFGRKTAEEKTFSNYPTKEHQTDRKKHLT